MVMGSPYQAVPAIIFEMNYYIPNYLLIRVNPSMPMSVALNNIAPVLKKYNPEAPFECRFTDQDYALKFAAEQQVAGLSAVFAILAIPLSWWGMHQWLQSYAYRTRLSGWIFAGTAVLTMLIAMLTVSVQSLRAALANPAKTLHAD